MSEKIKCIVVDDEPIAIDILVNHLSKIDSIEVVATCKNAMETFGVLNNNKIGLIFLDINMPEILGLSFAENIKIIFTTAYREYAVEGFDLQAVDYLLKPISLERLQQGVAKITNTVADVNKLETNSIVVERDDFILVRSNRKMIKVNFDEIKYIYKVKQ